LNCLGLFDCKGRNFFYLFAVKRCLFYYFQLCNNCATIGLGTELIKLGKVYVYTSSKILRDIKQNKLYLSPFNQSFQDLTLISAERNILLIKVLISSLYFSQQSAFGMLAIAEQPPHTHIVGKQGQQQGILAIAFEMFKAFPKVGTEQGVCLPFRHIRCETLSWLQLMPLSNIRIILPAVHTLKVFYYDNRTLKRWQVCQPHPALCKGRLTEQEEYTK